LRQSSADFFQGYLIMLFSGQQPPPCDLLLVVEIGNTTASIAIFRGEECLEVYQATSLTMSCKNGVDAQLLPLIMKYPALRDAALCSVVPSLDEAICSSLRSFLPGEVVMITSSMHLPFMLHYDSPDSFGADRIALCALCRRLYPGEAVIALDIGTAITVDVLGSGQDYLGGLIMPGLDLMAKALHEHTARLPLVGIAPPEMLLGLSTVECIRSGIVLECVCGLEGLIVKIKNWLLDEHDEESIRVIATGGNAALIAGMLDSSPVVEEHAVLRGSSYLFSLNAHPSE
jgi:type III pantothenate kinase